jgi:hypothetical protein
MQSASLPPPQELKTVKTGVETQHMEPKKKQITRNNNNNTTTTNNNNKQWVSMFLCNKVKKDNSHFFCNRFRNQ